MNQNGMSLGANFKIALNFTYLIDIVLQSRHLFKIRYDQNLVKSVKEANEERRRELMKFE